MWRKEREDWSGKLETGRPSILSKEQMSKVLEDFGKYIEENKDPIVAWFTSSYPPIYSEVLRRNWYINKDFIHDRDEFSELRKRWQEKQEQYLAQWATKNELNPTMCVFRLKQPIHSYTDRIVTEHAWSVTTVSRDMTDEELDAIIQWKAFTS